MALTASRASSLPASHFALHTQPHWLPLGIEHAKSIPTLEPWSLLFQWPETLFPRPPLGWLLLVIQQLVKCHLFGEVTSYLTPVPHSPAPCLFSSCDKLQLSILFVYLLAIMFFPPKMQFYGDKDRLCFGHCCNLSF